MMHCFKLSDRVVFRLRFGFLAFIALLAICGCSASSPQAVQINRVENLDAILRAYHMAVEQLQRPPKDMNELNPFLAKVGEPQKLIISPFDQKPYVIMWGIDPRQIAMTDPANPQPPLVAYESQAAGGQRYVATGFGVSPMSEEQFQRDFGPALSKDSTQ